MLEAAVQAEIDELVLALVSQVRAEARKYHQRAPQALERDELVGVGNDALVWAAANWERYCLVPETLVLTADLRWVPLGTLEPGQELVGVEEYSRGGTGRKYQRSVVQEVSRRESACLEIELEDGRRLTCTPDHLWLLNRQVSQARARATGEPAGKKGWWRADEIRAGDEVCSPLRVWPEGSTFDEGWLSGILDGEASVNGKSAVAVTQLPGLVADRIKQLLADLDIPHTLGYRNSDGCLTYRVSTRRYALELLGRVRPARLLPKAAGMWEGRRIWNHGRWGAARVVAVRPAGVREVVTLETSSHTFLAEGCVSHNCLRNGYSPTATNYFRAYALRRIRGAILDHLRGQDWVPRTVRTRFKVIQQASESQGGGCEADLAAGTGMEATVIRATLAAVARRPLSLDERTEDLPGQAEVEAQAVAGSVLRAIGAARSGLSLEAQAVLALRFYRGMSVAQIAEALRLPEHQVQELNDSSVLVIHQAMLGQVA